MTPAEHLIENAIYSLKDSSNFVDENTQHTECTSAEARCMAQHIVYSLYNGIFPDEIDDYEKVVRCKNCIHHDKLAWKCKLSGKVVTNVDFCSEGKRSEK